MVKGRDCWIDFLLQIQFWSAIYRVLATASRKTKFEIGLSAGNRPVRIFEVTRAARKHLAEELTDEKIADLMDHGMRREEAERAARRGFGKVTLIEERSRDIWQ